jgi:Sap, sulfolipid-1-addressing protein
MGKAIGDILPLAIGVAMSPVPIIAIVLMLGTPRARANGFAFAGGWLAGLVIVGTIMLVIASGNATQSSGSPAMWTNVLKLAFGVVFLALAVRSFLGHPKAGEETQMPKWLQTTTRSPPAGHSGWGSCSRGSTPRTSR